MDPTPELRRVDSDGGRRVASALAAAVALAVIGFLIGLGLGRQAGPGATLTPTPPEAAPFTSAAVSRELWTAYLNRNPGGDVEQGWGLCRLDAGPTCQGLAYLPRSLDLLARRVSQADWDSLAPITVPPGHYLLAGPAIGAIDSSAVLVELADDGTETLLGSAGQAVVEAVLWVDLGSLGSGRYAASITEYLRSSDLPDGRFTVQPWYLASGFEVAGGS
jgi:hypothetical protein